MPNRLYEASDRFEKRVMEHLETSGYLVRQTRGSKGLFDLVALAPAEWTDKDLLIQCKRGDGEGREHAKWNGLYDLAAKFWRLPVWADQDERGRIRYQVITGYHTAFSKCWPAEQRVL